MKLILHHLWFEIRGLKYLLMLWIALLVFFAQYWGYQIDARTLIPNQVRVPLPTPFLEILACLIAMHLGIRDTPAGTRGFWLTRPLRAPQLLIAKLIFLFTVVLVPWAMHDTAIVLGHGAEKETATTAVLSQMTIKWALPVIAFGVAALSGSFARALLNAAISFAIFAIIVPVAGFIDNVGRATELIGSEFYLLSWLPGLGVMLGALWMFLTRKGSQAWKMAGFGSLALLVAGLCVKSSANGLLNKRQQKVLGVETVAVSAELRRAREYSEATKSGKRDFTVAIADSLVSDVPDGFGHQHWLKRGVIEYPEGDRVSWAGYRRPDTDANLEFHLKALRDTLGHPDLVFHHKGDPFRLEPTILPVSPQNGARPNLSAKFTGTIQIDLIDYQSFGEIPVVLGQHLERDGCRIEITEIKEFDPSRDKIGFHKLLNIKVRRRMFSGGLHATREPLLYLLIPEQNLLIPGHTKNKFDRNGPVGLRAAELLYHFNIEMESNTFNVDDARLVVVGWSFAGSLRRKLELDLPIPKAK